MNSILNGMSFQDTTPDRRFESEKDTNQLCTKERSNLSKQKTCRPNYFSSGSLSSTECTRTTDSIGWPASESSTTTVNLSTFSDSFDPTSLLSFDGLNKRATNRNDIGLEILKAKIELGADPRSLSTHGGRSCMMFAVIANDYNFAKKLVEQGIDVNERTRSGETALGLADELQRDKIASLLRLKGAKH